MAMETLSDLEKFLFGDRRSARLIYSEPDGSNIAHDILVNLTVPEHKKLTGLPRATEAKVLGGLYPILVTSFQISFERDLRWEDLSEFLQGCSDVVDCSFTPYYLSVSSEEIRFLGHLQRQLSRRIGICPDPRLSEVFFDCRQGERLTICRVGYDPLSALLMH